MRDFLVIFPGSMIVVSVRSIERVRRFCRCRSLAVGLRRTANRPGFYSNGAMDTLTIAEGKERASCSSLSLMTIFRA